MDVQSGESEEEEVMGEGTGESEIEELESEWCWRRDKGQWLKWRGMQGDAVPPPQIYGRVRYPNGRSGTVTGTRNTTQKSSITEVECSTKSTVMMSDNKV